MSNWLKHLSKDKRFWIVGGRVFFFACLIFQNNPKEECSAPLTTQESSFPLKWTGPGWTSPVRFFSLLNKSSASSPCANVQVAGYSIFVTAQLCSFEKLGAEVSCAWCSCNLVFKAMQVCCCSVHIVWLGVSLYFSSQKSSQCKSDSSTSEVL